tara:strand:- start:359 stop:1396 length:1038 start_codon:yes stop_codon:yes gene_type:complete
MKSNKKIFFFIFFYFLLSDQIKDKLSDYNIYLGDPHNLITNKEFIPYELITPLFSDYAYKHRSIYIPENKKIQYHAKEAFQFPVGTIIAKTFYYPKDFNDLNQGISLKETRIMINKENGWIGLPYIWNDNETDAFLDVAGGIKEANWIDIDGNKQSINYIIPNMNQCKGCHNNSNKFIPIGPTARQLNSDYQYKEGIKNQLMKWNELELFYDLPEFDEIPVIARWNDFENYSINLRARAWLDINCAHCHNVNGPANNTGLYLDYYETDPKTLGIFKTPVAAGRGSGYLKYDIVPGEPDESILVYRFNSTDPGIMMPELGRTMIHKEGLELIKSWIEDINLSRVKF